MFQQMDLLWTVTIVTIVTIVTESSNGNEIVRRLCEHLQSPKSVQKKNQKFQHFDFFRNVCGPFYGKVHIRSDRWTLFGLSTYVPTVGTYVDFAMKRSTNVPEKVKVLELLIFFLDTFWTLEVLAKSPHNLVSVTTSVTIVTVHKVSDNRNMCGLLHSGAGL